MGDLTQSIRIRYDALRPVLDERSRRVWAGAEAQAIGRGGIARVAEATGMARDTVREGLRQVQAGEAELAAAGSERQRRPGGGRKKLAERAPRLRAALERKLDPVTRGDPMGPLRWTCLSAERLAEALRAEGHAVSGRSVNRPAARARLQLAVESQDAGGSATRRPGRAVPVHRPPGAGVPGPRAASRLGGFEEERVGGTLPQRGARVAPAGAAPKRCRCMISRTRHWARRCPTGSTT